MQYRKKYEIDPSFVDGDVIKWGTTGNGAYAFGEYKGQRYFIKRYTMGPRIPAKSIPDPVYTEMLNAAKWLEDKQTDMRKRMKGLNVDKDHIVVEEANFWDDDNLFVTVTRMIPGENKGFDYTTLDQTTFQALCVDMMELLVKIHAVGVAHGDLKEKNVLIRNDGGALVPYLIDFDSSYPSDYGSRTRSDGKPMLAYPVVYSEGYQSPEIAIYNFEEEGVGDASTITDKTDIFTMALIFHRLWTGDFPAVVGDDCPVGEAVYLDTEIRLSPKFDFVLGPTFENKFSGLLKWMLLKDTAQRPTAAQVKDALLDKLDVNDFFDTGDGAGKYDFEPHVIHKASMEVATKDEFKALNVKAFQKVTVGGQYKYLVKMKDGSEEILTYDQVIAKGYGKPKASSLCALWPEDDAKYEFAGLDAIENSGVLSIEAKAAGFKKFYFVALRSGGGYTTSAKGLVDRGLAKAKMIAAPASEMTAGNTPWPEHGSSFDQDVMAKRNIVLIEKVEEEGLHVYKLTAALPDGTRRETIVKEGYMRIMRLIK